MMLQPWLRFAVNANSRLTRRLRLERCERRLMLASGANQTTLDPVTLDVGEDAIQPPNVSWASLPHADLTEVTLCVDVEGPIPFVGPRELRKRPVEVEPGVWTRRAEMLYPRAEHANAVHDGKIYVFGGLDTHLAGPAAVEMFDPDLNAWTHVSTVPLSRHHFTAGASVYGDEIWLVGGKTDVDTSGVTRVDVYNVATDTWRQGPDLPEIHWGGPSVIIGQHLHVLTGAVDIDTSTDHHLVLDLTDESAGWSRAAPIPRARVHAAGVALNGEIYVVGGERNHTHNGGDTTDVQVYDPASDTWRRAAPLPNPRSHLEWSTFAYNGTIISASGVDSQQAVRGQSEVYQYDPMADAWSLLVDLPIAAVSPGAKVIDDVLYVFGGGDGDWFDGSLRDTHAWRLVPDETIVGDFTHDGRVDAADVYMLCSSKDRLIIDPAFDLTGDGEISFDDLDALITDIIGTTFGDANLDGAFTTKDIVEVLQFGEFEDRQTRNSGWHSGDWNCDGDFTSDDFVVALQYGNVRP